MDNKVTIASTMKLDSSSVRYFLESETYEYAEETRNYEKYLNFVLEIFNDINFTTTYTKDDLISDIEAFYKAIA